MKWKSIFIATLALLAPFSEGMHADNSNDLRVTAKVIEQRYCYGDNDLFTVSLRLDVNVANARGMPLTLKTPLVPWVIRVANSLKEAKAGHFLYEDSWSHLYPGDYKPADKTLEIAPGKSVVLHPGLGLVGRYNPAFSSPKTVSAGSYALVVTLEPEIERSDEALTQGTVRSITSEPFMIQVPRRPHVVKCDNR